MKTSEARLRAQRNYYQRNKAKILEKQRQKYADPEFRAELLEKRREQHKARTPEEKWAKDIYWKYGISAKEYWKIFEKQDGVCAICGKPPTKQKLCVDHCHHTDKVRGLLCKACNAAIGQLQDSVENCIKASDYLRRTS